MKDKSPLLIPLAFGLLLFAAALFMLPGSLGFSGANWRNASSGGPGNSDRLAGQNANPTPTDGPTAAPGGGAGDPSAALMAELLRDLSNPEARKGEAVLTFESAEALQRFLARAGQSGLKVLGSISSLNAVRVGFDDLTALRNDMRANAGDYTDAGGNFYVHIPGVPAAENRPTQAEVGFGDGALAFMGVRGDNSSWGKGVTIAILDSGVDALGTFGNRLRAIDIGQGLGGTGEVDGHGTAVAALAAGSAAGSTGTAPAANVLSIRVTGADGVSDIFTLAQGIKTAVDAGAQVVNISLGAYENSAVLTEMIAYAYQKGAVITAAGGNDTAATLTWPAADSRVVSVGSVDALGQQTSFSNSGQNLWVTAPGLELQTAWPGDKLVSFDGTSGSSPLVAGSIAALMSQVPGLTAQNAANLLAQYSADAGAAGRDPGFGYGTVDLGWAMNYNNQQYVDTSISSQYYRASEGLMDFVVQNRSGQPVSGLTLSVNAAGQSQDVSVPWLTPGARWTYTVPVDNAALAASGELQYSSRLRNPNGLVDQNPANNQRASAVIQTVK
jgi:hypothetical protein